MSNTDVSILISCANEEASIESCIRNVAQVMPESEIVVVHGGTDKTLEIARSLKSEFPQIVPVYNEGDRGKGHGIKTAIHHASRNVMAQFDADMQFFADDLPRLTAPVLNGECDLCLGSRFLGSSDRSAYQPSFFRDTGNKLLSIVISSLIKQKVTDVTAGIKAWTRGAVKQIDFRDEQYSYEAELVVRAGRLGLRIQEVPVQYASRVAGDSMHRSNVAVAKAGFVIIVKSILCALRKG